MGEVELDIDGDIEMNEIAANKINESIGGDVGPLDQ